ncbi:NADH-quinone oxidoreductase subunit NuoE family protein, partial [Magnetovibrio blakemorei]|uniref:NADH-quinone oxidoreductase subunit NuoE family protein n=1 Tax=Magnetovibrio blakemorei TaxID=28181 RepID=UPI000A412277
MGPKRHKGVERPKSTRPHPKVRHPSDGELGDVRALVGDTPKNRDLLIEHLHSLNDHFGHLSAGHMAALAQLLALAQIDVYETATFYAHFTTLGEGETPPPALTLRICDGPACRMAGAKALLTEALEAFGDQVRVCPAPCQGACDTPPSAILGQSRITAPTLSTLKAHIDANDVSPPKPAPLPPLNIP